MKFENRVALITGGTGALGSAVTRRFLQNGAHVITTYHGAASFRELQNALGERESALEGVQTDVTKVAEMQELVARIVAQHGHVDILVNLVGGYAGGVAVADLAEAEWDRVLQLNLRSAFASCRAALPYMLKNHYGRIVNTSSRGAVEVGAGESAYAVSKAGVLTLTKAIAQEVKGQGVTANVVLPGMIDTRANRAALPQADPAKLVKPESIAEVIAFLASAEARDINGAQIPIYGAS